MPIQFRNLVFEGGGVKGIAYIGAMQVLKQRGHLDHIIRVGGTSAGAINALLYALGMTIKEQQELLSSLNFKKFMDDSFGIIRDVRRLAKKFGWHEGDFFLEWIGGLIEQKLGNAQSTFADLKNSGQPDLYVTGTNLCTGYSEVFSHERHSDMSLAEAVRISMSIPLFFQAVRLGERQDVFVDGGVMVNYPVKLFDREKYIDIDNESYAARSTEYYNKENATFLLQSPDRAPYVYNRQTLGLRLDKQEEIALYRYNEPLKDKPIKKFPHYAKALLSAIMNVQENVHLHSDDWQRTVYINTLDVGTTDFNLSDAKKQALVQEGIKGAEEYFQWFEGEEVKVNRVEKG